MYLEEYQGTILSEIVWAANIAGIRVYTYTYVTFVFEI